MKVLIITRESLLSSPGGDTIQILQTIDELNKLDDICIDLVIDTVKINYSKYDILHFFNITRPSALLKHLRKTDLPLIISTIFVDYTELELSNKGLLFKLLTKVFGRDGIEYLKTIGRHIKRAERIRSIDYIIKGHKKSIQHLLQRAELLLPNSHSEYSRLLEAYGSPVAYTKVTNGISTSLFGKHSSPGNSNSRKGVLCVGRIEPVKNQLNLIRALNKTNLQLTIIGKASPNHTNYYQLCQKEAGKNITFLPHLPQKDLLNYYRSSKVHALVSWFETTGLASLEAGACGCQLVITAKGDTKEYFANRAFYCEPDDVEEIRKKIVEASECGENTKLSEYIVQNHTWEKAAEQTLEGYKMVLKESK